MSEVTRTAGVAGTFTVTFTQTPTGTPTLTLYSDAARTVVAVASTPLVATANPQVWTASYPATLAAGRYYLVVSAVYTVGQPAVLDSDDVLVLTAPSTSVTTRLVTLAEAKAYMGVTTSAHDVEIGRLVAQADGVVQNLAGPTLLRSTETERYAARRTLLLRRYPVVSVTAVASIVGGISTAYTGPATDYAVIDPDLGEISSPFAGGSVDVTYTAGLPEAPAEAVDAALVFVSYKYRRNHGGSESYMPAGQDSGIAPPMGVTALRDQIRLALGPYARGPSVG